MGVVLQELAIEPYLTVREVLARNAGYYPHPRPVAEVLELIGLLDKADARVKTLSGGQQRRLDLGLGIVGRPELIFLDEPTTGFDPSARRTAWDLVRSLADEGTTIILTTHYMEEAETLADRVAVLAKGRIVACGAPGSLGGRDRGQVTIRFLVPSGVSPTDLPLRDLPGAQVAIDDGEVVIHTDAELPVLQRLVNWAIAAGVDLPGLTVSHVTLEEVYLRLTGDTADRLDDEAAA
jgi:ABC-2 type transport system ATP-binding protein